MLTTFKNIEIIGVLSGKSTLKAKISNRPSHTLIYKESGESTYYFENKQVRLRAGTVLFIPEGTSYHFEKITEESSHRLVNFHAEIEADAAPQLFQLSDAESLATLLIKMEKNWRLEQNTAGEYERLSMLYKILSILEHQQNPDYVTNQTKSLIEPAVEYMENHIFDSDFKTSILPELCGMSSPTFRRIFTARFGQSPKKYIITQRLMQAKNIIESGEYKNISDVSLAVGYDDPLYFSKLFKSFYGTPPSLY